VKKKTLNRSTKTKNTCKTHVSIFKTHKDTGVYASKHTVRTLYRCSATEKLYLSASSTPNTVHMYCGTLPAKQVCTTWIHTGMLQLLACTFHYACYVSYLSYPQNISWLHVVKIPITALGYFQRFPCYWGFQQAHVDVYVALSASQLVEKTPSLSTAAPTANHI
jgi:hypothetical protein